MLHKKMKTFMEKYVYPSEQVGDTRCTIIQTHGMFDLKTGFPLTLTQFHEQELISCSCSSYYKGILVFIEVSFNISLFDI